MQRLKCPKNAFVHILPRKPRGAVTYCRQPFYYGICRKFPLTLAYIWVQCGKPQRSHGIAKPVQGSGSVCVFNKDNENSEIDIGSNS